MIAAIAVSMFLASSISAQPAAPGWWPDPNSDGEVVIGCANTGCPHQFPTLLLDDNVVSKPILRNLVVTPNTVAVTTEWVNRDPTGPSSGQLSVEALVSHSQSVNLSASVAASFGMSVSQQAEARAAVIGRVKTEARIDSSVTSTLSAGATSARSLVLSAGVVVNASAGPCQTREYEVTFTRYTADAVVMVGDLKRCTRPVRNPAPTDPALELVYCFDGTQVVQSDGDGSDMIFSVITGNPTPTPGCNVTLSPAIPVPGTTP